MKRSSGHFSKPLPCRRMPFPRVPRPKASIPRCGIVPRTWRSALLGRSMGTPDNQPIANNQRVRWNSRKVRGKPEKSPWETGKKSVGNRKKVRGDSEKVRCRFPKVRCEFQQGLAGDRPTRLPGFFWGGDRPTRFPAAESWIMLRNKIPPQQDLFRTKISLHHRIKTINQKSH